MNVFILIASYVDTNERCLCIKEMLQSIIISINYAKKMVRSTRIKILISYSLEKNIINPYSHEFYHGYIDLYYNESRLSQFEHYEILSNYINENSLIMFSDDDDLYAPEKINKIISIYFENKNRDFLLIHELGWFGFFTNLSDYVITLEDLLLKKEEHFRYKRIEYFQYAMSSNFFIDFFKSRFWNPEKQDNSINGTLDILFCMYLEDLNHKLKNLIKIKDVLSFKRQQIYLRSWTNF